MPLSVHDLSAALFVRGLTNLKMQLTKAEEYAGASGIGEGALLNATLAGEGRVRSDTSIAPGDLHMYTLAAHVHWTAEGARLAIARLLGVARVPVANDARSWPYRGTVLWTSRCMGVKVTEFLDGLESCRRSISHYAGRRH